MYEQYTQAGHDIDVSGENQTHQCGHSEDLNRQSSDGYTPLMVIIDEVLLQLLVVLQRQI